MARVLYIQTPGDRQMNDAIEVSDPEQFVKGESSRDLRVSLGAKELSIQLMETLDTVNDFYRFLEISTRVIASNPTEAI